MTFTSKKWILSSVNASATVCAPAPMTLGLNSKWVTKVGWEEAFGRPSI
jgi:hypothetical protein